MKNRIIVTLAFVLSTVLLIASYSCHQKKSKEIYTVKIKDIKLATRQDTISYALGFEWGRGIGRNVGLNKISNSFFNGVQDYLNGDTSLMGIYKTFDYLEKRQPEFKYNPLWPDNDTNIRVCDIKLVTKFDTMSYALGFAWCRGSYEIGISKVTPALIIGLSKGLKGDTSIFSYRSADVYLRKYIDELRLVKFADIKLKNEKWLAENKKNPGIITLPDGLQYKVIRNGTGISPMINDIVECNMIKKLINGTVVENSYENKEPKKFYLFSEIKGLSEAIQLMKEGDKWEIYLPYNLAYGTGGTKDQIPPFATVIFEVDLIKVTKNN